MNFQLTEKGERVISYLNTLNWQTTDISEIEERYKIKRVGNKRSCDRIVFLDLNGLTTNPGETVIKIAKHGVVIPNLSEIQTWKYLTKRQREFFLPIMDYCEKGNWLTMPRATEIERDTEIIENLLDELSRVNLFVNDLSFTNIGNYNGIKILDYSRGVKTLHDTNTT